MNCCNPAGALRLVIIFTLSIYSLSIRSQGIYQNWGITYEGGPDNTGVIFSTDSGGSNPVAHHFFTNLNKGGSPLYGSMTSFRGKLYGLASGDRIDYKSTLFEYDPFTGRYTAKVDGICGKSGYGEASGSLIVYNDQLYGTASMGGVNDVGELFKYDPVTNQYSKLIDFETSGGAFPEGDLTVFNNKMYGLTLQGGKSSDGVLFEFDPRTNIYTKKIDLADYSGSGPTNGLTLYNGKLYGTTYGGGIDFKGILFEYDPGTNVFIKKNEFLPADGTNPTGNLLLYDNKLWGLTPHGGASDKGVIFQFDPSTGVYTKKIDLTEIGGSIPIGALIIYKNKMFGLTNLGGDNNMGALFEYDPALNTYTKRFSFSNNTGETPSGTLTAVDNTIYGFTGHGGASDKGVIFEYNPDTYTYLKKVDFNAVNNSVNGSFPAGSLIYLNKSLYGTTEFGGLTGSGTIFKYDLATSTTTIEFDFEPAKGRFPPGDLIVANNKLYGRTINGGSNDRGVLFSFDPATKAYSKIFDFDSTNGGYVPDNRYSFDLNYYNDHTRSSLLYYNNKIYGTTHVGGAFDAGVLFTIDPVTDQFVKKIDFANATGKGPAGNILPFNGKLYGVAMHGGANDLGVLFVYDPVTNVYNKKLDFDNNGIKGGQSGLTLFNEKMYGVSYESLFEYDPLSNAYSIKKDVSGTNGSDLVGRFLIRNNLLYGTAFSGGSNNKGAIFEYNPVTNSYIVKANFDSTSNGAGPLGTLISIPASVADGVTGTCTAFPSFTISNANNNNWKGITNDYGEAIAEINPNGNDLGTITSSFYVQNNPVRNAGGLNYLNRSLTITVQNQPAAGHPVDVRLYIKKSEFDDLVKTPGSGITSINDLAVYKSEDLCSNNIGNDVVKLNTTSAEWGSNYVLTTQVSSFSTFHFSSVNAALPVTLLDFSVNRKNKNENQLDWQTSTEQNSSSFSIERSTDGIHFTAIANIPAAGNSSIKSQYRFIDIYSSGRNVFYRLKMIDKDNKFKYSKIIKLAGDGLPGITVSPNPVQNTLTIEGAGRFNQLQIIDASGKIIRQLSPGAINQYSVAGLKQGMYFIRFSNDKEVKLMRFVKL